MISSSLRNIFQTALCSLRANGAITTTGRKTIAGTGIVNTRFIQIPGMSKPGPVELKIEEKLSSTFQPSVLKIFNESFMHSVAKGSETHFKVVVVSPKFDGVSLIQRHRQVQSVLKDELSSGVHALSIVAKTPEQWDEGDKKIKPSPACMGGKQL